MTFDRHSQFDPIPGLSNAALLARIANDDATTALAASQTKIDGLLATYKVLASKVQDYGGGTDQDYDDFASTRRAITAERSKLPDLQATQTQTFENWDAARNSLVAKVGKIDENPGAIEQA